MKFPLLIAVVAGCVGFPDPLGAATADEVVPANWERKDFKRIADVYLGLWMNEHGGLNSTGNWCADPGFQPQQIESTQSQDLR